MNEQQTAEKAQRTTCLRPVWDGPYRMICAMGANGVCARHGRHQPHPEDGRPCKPNEFDGYCHTHGVYMDPLSTPPGQRHGEGA